MKHVIYVGRHSRYDTSLEEGKGGKLTEAGKAEAVQKMISYIISVFTDEELRNTRFVFVASPTRWKDKQNLGQRAVETGVLYKRAINKYLTNNCGMTQSQVRDLFLDDDCTDAMIIPTMQYLIREPNYWTEAPEFIEKLEKECGGRTNEFWHKLSRVGDEIKAYGQHVECAEDISKRMTSAFANAVQWGKSQKGVNTCVIMISHGETLQPYYDKIDLDFNPKTGYNDGVVFEYEGEKDVESFMVYDAALEHSKTEISLSKCLGDEK